MLAVTDPSGTVIAAGGRRAADWPLQGRVSARRDDTGAAHVSMASGMFQFASAPLSLQQHDLGTLQLARALDARYAQDLSTLSGTATLIVSRGVVIASTLPGPVVRDLTPATLRTLPTGDAVRLGSSEYAVKELFQDDETAVYALDSIDASTRDPMQKALGTVFLTAIGAFALAAFASVWLARTISRPIDTLSKSLSEMTASRDFEHPVQPTGFSLEVDTLTTSFNTMMRSVSRGRGRNRRGLRRRDSRAGARPRRAGSVHRRPLGARQRRVRGDRAADGSPRRRSSRSCASARCCTTSARSASATPCCASPDRSRAKSSSSSSSIPASARASCAACISSTPHLPIVELHHERPDGQGYPHGLRGHEIPLLARIVHVADAFDAMTSARAYRPARSRAAAVRELWRCAGPQFDAEVVDALTSAMPAIEIAPSERHASAGRRPLASVARSSQAEEPVS